MATNFLLHVAWLWTPWSDRYHWVGCLFKFDTLCPCTFFYDNFAVQYESTISGEQYCPKQGWAWTDWCSSWILDSLWFAEQYLSAEELLWTFLNFSAVCAFCSSHKTAWLLDLNGQEPFKPLLFAPCGELSAPWEKLPSKNSQPFQLFTRSRKQWFKLFPAI